MGRWPALHAPRRSAPLAGATPWPQVMLVLDVHAQLLPMLVAALKTQALAPITGDFRVVNSGATPIITDIFEVLQCGIFHWYWLCTMPSLLFANMLLNRGHAETRILV